MPASTTVVLAVAGVALLVAAGIVAVLTLGGSGARTPGHGAAAATGAGPSSGAPTAAAAATASSPAPRPAASHHDPLGSAAASYVSRRDGVVLAAVYDLRTGQTWQFGQGQPQDEASVVKLDVLETLLAERGRSGIELSAGDRTLAEQMIEDSDNDAATSLWDEVGGASGIRSFNTSAGLADTVPSSCVNCPGFPWPGWGLTTTIPGDQLTLLRTLVEPNSLLTNAERNYALSLMENVTPGQRWGVSGGVPAQATVALKNGWLPLNSADNNWQINSVGWISGGGRDYLIAVLTTGNPTEQYGIDTIDRLAAMVWNGMA
ncbi:MAG TPA: serine hydrolase [Streptosporangiaceae bacterium]|nr:serine hydrolase [Streptosporangiaceae bacterium]